MTPRQTSATARSRTATIRTRARRRLATRRVRDCRAQAPRPGQWAGARRDWSHASKTPPSVTCPIPLSFAARQSQSKAPDAPAIATSLHWVSDDCSRGGVGDHCCRSDVSCQRHLGWPQQRVLGLGGKLESRAARRGRERLRTAAGKISNPMAISPIPESTRNARPRRMTATLLAGKSALAFLFGNSVATSANGILQCYSMARMESFAAGSAGP